MAPLRPATTIFLLFGLAAAKSCTNITIPVDINSRQGLFTKVSVEENLDVDAFALALTNIGANYTEVLLQDYQNLIGSYQISAKYCHPDGASNSSTVQVLSHGIGFDKSYWDLPFNNYNYSYTDVATSAGYSTLAIDRFGIGNSSHGDPFNTVQAQAEVEALNQITLKLRNGQIPTVPQSFDTVIHVGHSFGSIQSYWLSALYPDNTDGLVLTGWSSNATWLPQTIAGWNLHSARLNQPIRFGTAGSSQTTQSFQNQSSAAFVSYVQAALKNLGVNQSLQDLWNEIAATEIVDLVNGWNQTVQALNYPSGYMTWSDFAANQYAFLLPSHYDLSLGLFAESTKQPVTTGEILTIGSSPPETNFDGPVLVVTGEQDNIFCGGDCYATGGAAASIPATAQKIFPNASDFEAYIQPFSGHGLNLHYNSTGAFKYIQTWLAAHDLDA